MASKKTPAQLKAERKKKQLEEAELKTKAEVKDTDKIQDPELPSSPGGIDASKETSETFPIEYEVAAYLGNDVEIKIAHVGKTVGVVAQSFVNDELGECEVFVSRVEVGLSDTDKVSGIVQKAAKNVGLLSDVAEVTFEVPYYGKIYIITKVIFTNVYTGDQTELIKTNEYDVEQ